jgi:DNA-binding SARP family transcriptional activator
LTLLNAFELSCEGVPVQLPMSVQRLIAFVALHPHPLLRLYVAGSLWLDVSEERASANLRSALWRLHRRGLVVVETTDQQLRLGANVEVDVHEAEALARRIMKDDNLDGIDLAPASLSRDLLPDWYDEWVMIERERFRQLRLWALDALCDRLMRGGRLSEALELGLLSVSGEPLRETAHRAVVRVHLADGNVAEAIRHYRFYRRLLREHLGIEPSARMRELMHGFDDLETVG